MRDHLVLFINGRRYAVRGTQAFATLSSYLRYELGQTGTKVVCAEGDCGSCSVLVGRVDGESIQYRPLTSCIQFLYQLDGAHVITIEGLQYNGQLNPVQQAMVKCHGAQCGFCTPGFVVSMCGLFNERRNLDERALAPVWSAICVAARAMSPSFARDWRLRAMSCIHSTRCIRRGQCFWR